MFPSALGSLICPGRVDRSGDDAVKIQLPTLVSRNLILSVHFCLVVPSCPLGLFMRPDGDLLCCSTIIHYPRPLIHFLLLIYPPFHIAVAAQHANCCSREFNVVVLGAGTEPAIYPDFPRGEKNPLACQDRSNHMLHLLTLFGSLLVLKVALGRAA